MVKKPVLTTAAALTLPLLLACNSFTEYSGAPETGILFLDPFTLEVTGSLDGMEGGTAMCNLQDGKFAVLGNTGVMQIYDAETMALDTSFTVGAPQSAGYSDMVFIPWKSSVYLISAQGSVLEVGVPAGNLKAEITGLGTPARIVRSRTGSHVYVSDPSNQRVHGVGTQTNARERTYNYNHVPTVMACNSWGADTLLICTTDPTSIGYMQPGEAQGWPRRVSFSPAPYPATDMISTSFHHRMFSAHPNYSSSFGYVAVIDSLMPNYYVINNMISVPGNPYRLASHDDQLHLYVLSLQGEGGASVYLYHYPDFEAAQLIHSAQLPGVNPVDVIFAGNRLVILTY